MSPAHGMPAHYTPLHRAPSALTRRRVLLGLSGIAAVPAAAAATIGLRQARSGGASPAGPTPQVVRDVPAAAPVPIAADGGGPVAFRAGRAMLGAYLSLQGMSQEQSLALRRRQLGRDERIVHVFLGWTDTLPTSIPGLPPKAVPMVSWRGAPYAGILDGSSDGLIAAAAQRLKKFGRPVLLRWAWEMNGDWYAWGGAKNGDDPAAYVKAWRRVHGIFAGQGADNISWVWSPNWNSRPAAAWNQPAAYYPGDRFVDWVGVSGYNLNKESPAKLFDELHDAYAERKPIIVAEVGAVDRGGTTKADWTTLFAGWVRSRPGVGAVTWFDTDTHPDYDERWRIDTSPESTAAYRAMAQDERFAG